VGRRRGTVESLEMTSDRERAAGVGAEWPEADPSAAHGGVNVDGFPRPVVIEPGLTFYDYYRRRLVQQIEDFYAGVRISKLPEDLRTYEHLLWHSRADVVVEIGVQFGGSALWFRDRLRTNQSHGRIAGARYVGVDIDVAAARAALDLALPRWSDDIVLIEGDVNDPATVMKVHDAVPTWSRCMVVEDSAHDHASTLAALNGLADLVPVGGWFIVEDGMVDEPELRMSDAWPVGVQRAVSDFLDSENGQTFTMRRDMELYGLTAHPRGFLERRRA
jgi:cephalosporin hydroxylase